MKSLKPKTLRLFLCLSLCVILSFTNITFVHAKNIIEATANAQITGIVYNPDGITPSSSGYVDFEPIDNPFYGGGDLQL